MAATELARPDVLIPGDIIAIYAGDSTEESSPVGSVVIEQTATRDDHTPEGYLTLWTTGGRFDVPATSKLDVLAWAYAPGTGVYL